MDNNKKAIRQLELAIPHQGIGLVTKRGAGHSITQRNELVEAKYGLSIQELRLIMICASRINPKEPFDWNNPNCGVFEVTAEDWKQAYSSDNKNLYKLLKEGAERLFENHIELNTRESETYYRWVSSSSYFRAQAKVKLRFTREVLLFLTQVADRYTTVRFEYLAKLPTTYSWKFYMLMAQFEDTGFRIISLDDFRHAMDCADQHQLYGDLKKRVILPSVQKVNENTNLKISCTEVKHGRKVVKLKFRIKKILPGGAELTEGEFIPKERAEMKFQKFHKKDATKLEQRWKNRDWAEKS